jgi:hypothetical protein
MVGIEKMEAILFGIKVPNVTLTFGSQRSAPTRDLSPAFFGGDMPGTGDPKSYGRKLNESSSIMHHEGEYIMMSGYI